MNSGKILLSLSLHGRGQEISNDHQFYVNQSIRNGNTKDSESTRIPSQDTPRSPAPSHKRQGGKHLMKAIAGRLEKIFTRNEEPSRNDYSSELSTTVSDHDDYIEEHSSNCSFEESVEMMHSMNEDREMPENLQGGILLDQTYMVPPKDLNKFIFDPNSQFRRDLAELQGTTDVQEGVWTLKSEETPCLMRVVTYTKAATKLVKAVKATEEQTYIKANGREFAVSVSVSTPDVPYGNTFKVELLYKIMPGPEPSSGQESSRLVVSWGINFYQNTMMKGMIEGGARQGLKDSFDQFAGLLAQNFEVLSSADILDKDKTLATLETAHQSDWELATEYFCNFTVFSTAFMILYVFVHFVLCGKNELHVHGLEFGGLNLPDSLGELITSGIIVLHLERVYDMVTHFVQARLQRGKRISFLFIVSNSSS